MKVRHTKKKSVHDGLSVKNMVYLRRGKPMKAVDMIKHMKSVFGHMKVKASKYDVKCLEEQFSTK